MKAVALIHSASYSIQILIAVFQNTMCKSFPSISISPRLTKLPIALSPSDNIALAALILSIPSVIATVFGAIISYQSFMQYQALGKFGPCTLVDRRETLTS